MVSDVIQRVPFYPVFPHRLLSCLSWPLGGPQSLGTFLLSKHNDFLERSFCPLKVKLSREGGLSSFVFRDKRGPRGQTWALPSSGLLTEFPSDRKMLRPVPGEKEEHHWSLFSGKSLHFGILSSLLCTKEVTTGSSPLSCLPNQGNQCRHNYFLPPSCLIKRNPSAHEGLVGRIRGHRRGQRVNSST